MREQWARRIALLTGQLVLVLSIAFALIQNPWKGSDTTESRGQALLHPESLESNTLDLEHIEAGHQIYKQQRCARCHSIAGEGNSRNPLDNVGAKRTAKELRDWITGVDALQGMLPTHVLRLKQRYSVLPGDDLDVLIIYMQSLRL